MGDGFVVGDSYIIVMFDSCMYKRLSTVYLMLLTPTTIPT